MYVKKILKKEINIKKENIIVWKSFIKIDESSFTGRNPPEEIIVIAKFNELNDLIPRMFRIIKIDIVNPEYNKRILIDCFKISVELKDKKLVKEKREITKINIVKKYLFMSFVSKLILVKTSLFINTFFGLLKERIWLIEYLVKEYIFKNLKPELVEKKDPPMITSKIYTKFKLVWSTSREIPIFEILLAKDKKLYVKLAS